MMDFAGEMATFAEEMSGRIDQSAAENLQRDAQQSETIEALRSQVESSVGELKSQHLSVAGEMSRDVDALSRSVRFFTVFHCFPIILSLFPSLFPSFCQFFHHFLFAGNASMGSEVDSVFGKNVSQNGDFKVRSTNRSTNRSTAA